MNKSILTALALAALCLDASAQEKFVCPPGSTAVSTGSFNAQSCVGSSLQGLVESTLPSAAYDYLGVAAPRANNPIYVTAERPEVPVAPSLPPAIAHIAAAETFLSARPRGIPNVTDKLAADWKFVFEGPVVLPGARMAWMGGVLSRSMDGSLSFETAYGSDRFSGPIDAYRDDIQGFMGAVGYSTARLFQERYGMNASFRREWQRANGGQWDAAMTRRFPAGSTLFIGKGFAEGGDFVTVAFGSDGFADHVVDARGRSAGIDEFASRPEFTALTGRGVARKTSESR